MYNRYQKLLFLSYINKHLDNSLLRWEVQRRTKGTPSHELRYIKKTVEQVPPPDQPLKLLIYFIKCSNVRSRTLDSVIEENQDLWEGDRQTQIRMLESALSDLNIPTVWQ